MLTKKENSDIFVNRRNNFVITCVKRSDTKEITMNFKTIRVTACGLATILAFSGMSLTAKAAGESSVLPSGGVNLALSRGNSLSNVATDTVMPIEAIIEWAAAEEAGLVVQDAEPTEEDLFRNLVIAQVTNYVNVRSIPSEEGEIVGKLYNNSVGTFISEENGWYQITSGTVTGYVKGEFCVTGEEAVELARKVGTRIATVNTTTLKVRTEPSLEASVLGLVPLDDELVVLEEAEGWVKVDVEEGIGWISTDYATLHSEFVQAESREEEAARLAKEEEERRRAREAAAAKAAQNASGSAPAQTYVVSGDSAMGSAVAEYALQFVGNPYVYGGTSLTNGADCSGFVMSVYANFGVSLPHSSSADRSQGAAVDGIGNAQPGDIVCYSGHVALYIGNGQIVHASNSTTGIIVSNADYRKILAVRRIF